MAVKHSFTSPIADGGDPNLVGPDEWNANHVIDAGTIQTYPQSALVMFVSPTGSDSNGGLSADAPKATIQAAYNALRTYAEANYTPESSHSNLGVGRIFLLPGDHDVGTGVSLEGLRPVEIRGTLNGEGGHSTSNAVSRVISSSSTATEFIKIAPTLGGGVVGYGLDIEDVAFRINSSTNTSLTKVLYIKGMDYAKVKNCRFTNSATAHVTTTAVYQESGGDSAWCRIEGNHSDYLQFYKAAVSPNGTNFNRGIIRDNVVFYGHATAPAVHFEGDWYSGLVEGNNFEGAACFIKCESSFADHNVFINNSGEKPNNTNPVYWFTSGTITDNVIIGGRFTCADSTIGVFAQFDANAFSNTVIGHFDATGTAGQSEKIVDNAAAPGRNHIHRADWGSVVRYKSGAGATIGDSDFMSTTKVPNGTVALGYDSTGSVASIWAKANGAWTQMPSFGSTAAAVGTSAGGSAVTASKSDHVHATGAGTPSTQAFGDAAATGTGPAAAMTDHKHAMPANPVSFASPSVALGTAAAAGAAGTVIRSDSTILAFDATVPVTQAMGDSAAVGAATVASRRDHKHGMPALGTTAAAVGTSSGGSATTPSKSDHVHATGAGTPTTQALGDAAATGSGPAAAMTDHKHAMPSATTTSSGLTMSTARLLGRTTAATGAIEEITVGTGLSLSAGSLTATGGAGSVASDTIWDAKGDLAAGTGADTAAKLTVGTNTYALTADSSQSTGLKWTNAPISIIRTSDGTGITTNTTLADDAVLTFTAALNTTYLVEALLVYTAGTTGDIKVALAAPASSTGGWSSTAVSGNAGLNQGTASSAALGAFGTGVSFGGAGITAFTMITLVGVVNVVGSAGSIRIQVAQGTSDAAATTLRAGSVLRLTPAV